MSPRLVLGPLLRYVGPSEAAIWVETDAACEVEVLGHTSRTFRVEGHHYAIVTVAGLKPGQSHQYGVALDGGQVWPEPGSGFPPSTIRTIAPQQQVRLVFGSCRLSLPHEPPFSLTRGEDRRGRDTDALCALALKMRREPPEAWPQALLLLGDQIYADKLSQGLLAFVRSRRDPNAPPGEEAADFEEYTRLYWESWRDPAIRWLLSTVASAMIFDDHDVHDDWNTSEAWVAEMRAEPWWDARITGAFMSYWLYQHLGNLPPEERREDELLRQVQEAADGGPILRAFAYRASRETAGSRWSYCRDVGPARLVVLDSRAGRVLKDGQRAMVDDDEWDWIERHATGGCDHLLLGTSLPVLLGPGMHHLEAWNEAVCGGAWGRKAAQLGEKIRRRLDAEHWAAFQSSWRKLIGLITAVGAGARGRSPATIVMLSGDVHHSYLARVRFRRGIAVQSAVYQAVCSPFRNPLGANERRGIRACWSRPMAACGRGLARLAGVTPPDVRWPLTHVAPWFDNQVATLAFEGRNASLLFEKAIPGETGEPRLEPVFEHRLA